MNTLKTQLAQLQQLSIDPSPYFDQLIAEFNRHAEAHK